MKRRKAVKSRTRRRSEEAAKFPEIFLLMHHTLRGEWQVRSSLAPTTSSVPESLGFDKDDLRLVRNYAIGCNSLNATLS